MDGRRDVAFASGRVAAVDTTIPRETAREVVDVSGAYVAPGLIDLHAHAIAVTIWGSRPMRCAAPRA